MSLRLALILATLLGVSSTTSGKDDALPRQNLLVELRWVTATPTSAATHRVVSTTAGQDVDATAARSVLVANGEAATIILGEQGAPARQADLAIGVLVQAPAPRTGAGSSTKAAAASPQAAVTPVLTLAPTAQRDVAARPQGTSVRVRWPGGRAPARVDLHATTPGNGGIQTSLDVEIDRWTTVTPVAPRPGDEQSGASVVATRPHEAAGARELQIRVSAAP